MKVAKDIHLENLVSRESKTVIVFLPGNLWMNTQSNLLQLVCASVVNLYFVK